MDKVIINLAVEEQDGMDSSELVELGTVSEETKGGAWGIPDGGGGWSWSK